MHIDLISFLISLSSQPRRISLAFSTTLTIKVDTTARQQQENETLMRVGSVALAMDEENGATPDTHGVNSEAGSNRHDSINDCKEQSNNSKAAKQQQERHEKMIIFVGVALVCIVGAYFSFSWREFHQWPDHNYRGVVVLSACLLWCIFGYLVCRYKAQVARQHFCCGPYMAMIRRMEHEYMEQIHQGLPEEEARLQRQQAHLAPLLQETEEQRQQRRTSLASKTTKLLCPGHSRTVKILALILLFSAALHWILYSGHAMQFLDCLMETIRAQVQAQLDPFADEIDEAAKDTTTSHASSHC